MQGLRMEDNLQLKKTELSRPQDKNLSQTQVLLKILEKEQKAKLYSYLIPYMQKFQAKPAG